VLNPLVSASLNSISYTQNLFIGYIAVADNDTHVECTLCSNHYSKNVWIRKGSKYSHLKSKQHRDLLSPQIASTQTPPPILPPAPFKVAVLPDQQWAKRFDDLDLSDNSESEQQTHTSGTFDNVFEPQHEYLDDNGQPIIFLAGEMPDYLLGLELKKRTEEELNSLNLHEHVAFGHFSESIHAWENEQEDDTQAYNIDEALRAMG